jgi:hypothetical protein
MSFGRGGRTSSSHLDSHDSWYKNRGQGIITRRSLVPWTGLRAGESSPRYLKAKPRHLSLGFDSFKGIVDSQTRAKFPRFIVSTWFGSS